MEWEWGGGGYLFGLRVLMFIVMVFDGYLRRFVCFVMGVCVGDMVLLRWSFLVGLCGFYGLG